MAVSAELDLQIQKFSAALKRAEGQLKGFSSRAGKAGSDTGGMMGGGIMSGISAAMAGLGALIAAAVVAAGIGAIVMGAIARAADMEQMQIRMEVLLGDTDKAKEVISNLQRFAADTPFEMPEIAKSANMLMAFGVGADDVLNTLRMIGDVSSGVGIPLTEMADLFGRNRVQGRMFAKDIREFTGRGIPIIKELAKQFNVTEAAVMGLVSAGKVNFPDVEKAFASMTSASGQYGGMMARQAKTLTGLWSTFKDEIGFVMLELGKPISDELRPILAEAIKHVAELKAAAAGIGSTLSGAMSAVVAAFQSLASEDVSGLLKDALVLAAKETVNTLWRGMNGAASAFGAILAEFVKASVQTLALTGTPAFWKGMGEALKGIALMFNGLITEGLGSMLQGMKEMPMVGGKLNALGGGLRSIGKDERTMGGALFDKGGNTLGPSMDRIATEAGKAVSNISKAFNDGVKNTSDAQDASGERWRLGGAFANMRSQIAANADAARNVGTMAKREPGAAGDGAATEPKLALNSGIAGAINRIAGRSANELILSNAKEQTAVLKSVDTKLSKVITNTAKDKPAPNIPSPSVKFIFA